jgi:hypothetical protein
LFDSEEEKFMRKLTILLAAVAMFGFTASVALAQCTFNEPAKAKGFKMSMVRSYASCPGITFPSSNTSTSTGGGTPACTPPFAHSVFKFNSKGSCSVKTKQKLEAPCSTGDGTYDCSNLSIQLKCKGIVQDDGVTPVTPGMGNGGDGWGLNTVARATFSDRDNGDMTVIDFPARFAVPAAKKGKLKMKSDTNYLLTEVVFSPGAELPPCTGIQLISIAVADPDGNIFAVPGSSTR